MCFSVVLAGSSSYKVDMEGKSAQLATSATFGILLHNKNPLSGKTSNCDKRSKIQNFDFIFARCLVENTPEKTKKWKFREPN